MIWSCKNLLLVLLLAFFIFLGLSLARTHGDVIINNIIMFVSRSTSGTVSVGVISVTVFATLIWKRQEIKKKIKALDKNIANLEERLQNTEKKRADDVQNTAIQMNLGFCIIMTILENQREQFKLDLEDVQRKMEEIKEELQSLERKIAECEERKETNKTEEYLRKKQWLLNSQRKLERRKEELEKLQLNTEKVLQSTEGKDFLILTERKMELKNDMTQLNEQLEEEKKEREELQQSWFLIF